MGSGKVQQLYRSYCSVSQSCVSAKMSSVLEATKHTSHETQNRRNHVWPAAPPLSLLRQYCAAGILLGLPLSIHKKSYWPVTLAAVAGTAADFKEARQRHVARCTKMRLPQRWKTTLGWTLEHFLEVVSVTLIPCG